MCTGTDSEIIAALPIIDVVPGMKTRPRVVGNLVALQARIAQSLFDQLCHGDLLVFTKEANTAAAILVVEGSPFFDGEVVGREMGRLEAEGGVEVVFEIWPESGPGWRKSGRG